MLESTNAADAFWDERGDTMKAGKLVFACTLVLLVLGSALAAQEKKSEPDPAHPKAVAHTETAAESGKSGPNEGIKVHGHWTIDVKDRDGSVVSHVEFENAFNAPNHLAALLGRQASPGFWSIALGNNAGPTSGPCAGTCYIGEPGEPTNSQNLKITVAATLTLSGSVTATNTTNITAVATELGACDPTHPPSAPCHSGTGVRVTQTVLSAPINVQAGQDIVVKVEISFS
jgi:hypothetical protein